MCGSGTWISCGVGGLALSRTLGGCPALASTAVDEGEGIAAPADGGEISRGVGDPVNGEVDNAAFAMVLPYDRDRPKSSTPP